MKRYVAAAAVLSILTSVCTSDSSSSGKRGMTNMETGAIVGAVGGAVANKKNRTAGAIVGAVGGGLAGGAIGANMDGQKKDLEKNLQKEIQAGSVPVDKMSNDVVRITMNNQTAFDTNSTTVKPGFYSTMDKVADIVIRWGKTTVTIVGHRDNKGTSEYNQKLSEQRALAVAGASSRMTCFAPRDIWQVNRPIASIEPVRVKFSPSQEGWHRRQGLTPKHEQMTVGANWSANRCAGLMSTSSGTLDVTLTLGQIDMGE
jgi:outer membrane protein OmpA-like peptidoglycan-associated protein